ncbi:MAG: uracil-DNA glycosylase [Candidatus Nanopelagicaceae bacterium]|nr:uracil-DNA glycosylase [Candidatus Nanopelagicaceae bacterium]
MTLTSGFLRDVHPEWLTAIKDVVPKIEEIESSLQGSSFNPAPENVFRALRNPLRQSRVVIFGQDPYPNREHAMGLAFSVPGSIRPLPRTLVNIFRELHEDIGVEIPSHGDLSPWSAQGVLLLNRILTAPQGKSAGHSNLGWEIVTNEIARVLGERKVVAIFWGNYAKQLQNYFAPRLSLQSVHPSPLSASRGFFGSKPFSKTNQLLAEQSQPAIDWSLT